MHIYNIDFFQKYFPKYIQKKYGLEEIKIFCDLSSEMQIQLDTKNTPPFSISAIPTFCGGVFVSNLFVDLGEEKTAILLSVIDDFCYYNGYSNVFLILSKENNGNKSLLDLLPKREWELCFTTSNVRTENKCDFYRKFYDIPPIDYENCTLLKHIKEI